MKDKIISNLKEHDYRKSTLRKMFNLSSLDSSTEHKCMHILKCSSLLPDRAKYLLEKVFSYENHEAFVKYIENFPLTVIKNDQRREAYDRQKLFSGIMSACKKRPVSLKKIESIVDNIEDDLEKMSKTEVGSMVIGKLVMDALYGLDDDLLSNEKSVCRDCQYVIRQMISGYLIMLDLAFHCRATVCHILLC